jgi:hypothetical protein
MWCAALRQTAEWPGLGLQLRVRSDLCVRFSTRCFFFRGRRQGCEKPARCSRNRKLSASPMRYHVPAEDPLPHCWQLVAAQRSHEKKPRRNGDELNVGTRTSLRTPQSRGCLISAALSGHSTACHVNKRQTDSRPFLASLRNIHSAGTVSASHVPQTHAVGSQMSRCHSQSDL